jgi:methylmalonyl-CoA mutase N-terminal domain/subunit
MDKKKLEQAKRNWEETTLRDMLSKAKESKPAFKTLSGIELERLYTPLDTEGSDYTEQIGFPGDYPFTRGIQPTMYRGRLWTMRQYAGFGSAEDTNKRYKYLLEQGQTGLSVAFDLPTQMGYDSTHPLAAAEVGKVGVAIDSLEDMERLFDGIPLDKVSTSMTINSTASILLAMYMTVAEKQGVDPSGLEGTIQNDVLKEYIARGTYIYPPGASMRIITDIFAFCNQRLPKWNMISISGYHMREAGSTAVQEVAFTLADGIAYVQAAIDAGLDVDKFAARLSFFFNVHNHFLEEVAKFRAARRLWARIMKERFEAKKERSMMLRFHTQTAGCSLTAQQPENNVIRVTIQALAAVLGGTQSLHTNSMDEALALPSDKAVRIALRTQQVIAHESGVTGSIDPLGGAYLIERLTDTIEEESQAYIEKIDRMGGMVRAIEEGYPQREIHNSAYDYQLDVEREEEIVVGVNRFQIEESVPENLLRVDPEVGEKQRERIEALKKRRDSASVEDALATLEKAARGEANVMPPILEAVRSYATLGEISDCLRKVFGEYTAKTEV